MILVRIEFNVLDEQRTDDNGTVDGTDGWTEENDGDDGTLRDGRTEDGRRRPDRRRERDGRRDRQRGKGRRGTVTTGRTRQDGPDVTDVIYSSKVSNTARGPIF